MPNTNVNIRTHTYTHAHITHTQMYGKDIIVQKVVDTAAATISSQITRIKHLFVEETALIATIAKVIPVCV